MASCLQISKLYPLPLLKKRVYIFVSEGLPHPLYYQAAAAPFKYELDYPTRHFKHEWESNSDKYFVIS